MSCIGTGSEPTEGRGRGQSVTKSVVSQTLLVSRTTHYRLGVGRGPMTTDLRERVLSNIIRIRRVEEVFADLYPSRERRTSERLCGAPLRRRPRAG